MIAVEMAEAEWTLVAAENINFLLFLHFPFYRNFFCTPFPGAF
jgi:hypothetical protein